MRIFSDIGQLNQVFDKWCVVKPAMDILFFLVNNCRRTWLSKTSSEDQIYNLVNLKTYLLYNFLDILN